MPHRLYWQINKPISPSKIIKKSAYRLKSEKRSSSQVFPTQNWTKILCAINFDVKTCQVRCGWGSKAS